MARSKSTSATAPVRETAPAPAPAPLFTDECAAALDAYLTQWIAATGASWMDHAIPAGILDMGSENERLVCVRTAIRDLERTAIRGVSAARIALDTRLHEIECARRAAA